MLLLRSPACWSAWYSPTGSFAGCIPPRGRAPSPSLGTRGGAGRLDQRAADAAYIRPRSIGEVAEWPKAPDSKSGLGASPTWVRLPPSPQKNRRKAWRGVRVAEGARLEIVCTERYRGFESLSLL